MVSWVDRGKVRRDVFAVPNKLGVSVREHKMYCLLERVEGDKPISVVPDHLGRLCVPKTDLEIPEGLSGSVIGDSGVDPREDDIKVNCLALQDLDPL